MARLTKFLTCGGYGNDHECSFVQLLTSYFDFTEDLCWLQENHPASQALDSLQSPSKPMQLDSDIDHMCTKAR